MNPKLLRERLNRIYARVPSFECKEGCHECCGPWSCEVSEYVNIRSYLRESGIPEKQATELICPYVDSHGRCEIYPARPLLCRLFGATKSKANYAVRLLMDIEELMVCPHGCGPDRILTEGEAGALFEEIHDIDIELKSKMGTLEIKVKR